MTYRQLDCWDNSGLLRPSVSGATGSGSYRRYSERDVAIARAIGLLLDAGVSLGRIRRALEDDAPEVDLRGLSTLVDAVADSLADSLVGASA